jgi:hypothetical protein
MMALRTFQFFMLPSPLLRHGERSEAIQPRNWIAAPLRPRNAG